MGLPDLRISNEEVENRSREGKVEGAGTLRRLPLDLNDPTTTSVPSPRKPNTQFLPGA